MNKKMKLPVCKNMKEAMGLIQDQFRVLLDVKNFVKDEIKRIDENGADDGYEVGYRDAMEKVHKEFIKSVETNINGGRY